ncbi:hypothetical protein HCY52_08425 [Acinetobacter radioresistens]|uniref:hypothetical protein n=1 Tax=Acinetobacter radioresistens TaxID=40216 RepID=UPI002004CCC6|nr:hypothetical protein [Acinetobacter radioresistens]MCK4083841.1 hypothetical protein [Acinetobacter radioresistens]
MILNEPSSNVERIGTAVFGKRWMTQTAKYISEISNRTISRQVIQRWHNDDKIPLWAHTFLKKMTEARFKELQYLHENIDNCLVAFRTETKKKA